MSDMKHTPGPWVYRLEAVRTVIYHKGEIGERAIACGAGHYPDHIANARLIAAAPELLDALEFFLGLVGESRGVDGFHLNGDIADWEEFDDLINAARAAIAKAKGTGQ